MALTLLTTRHLSRSFGGLKAVQDVDLDLTQGEIHALIGPNGAGKTTLVSLLCGRLAPDTGQITFEGEDITHVPAHARVRRGIAYTFQITSIYPRLPVFDNVALAAQSQSRGRGHANLEAATFAALSRVGLEDMARRPAGELAY
ncbi:ATP-binding cassette domain-containing protein, partial [uncultured Amaricoccus sp.]|uniref:ATP-binding cassette domain-containing protein n=1 Tax=uncultured Amaricoccus sp. TaxID=339341 RepID=UPI00260FE531